MAYNVALGFFMTCMISTMRAASIGEKAVLPEHKSRTTNDSQVHSLKRNARTFLGFDGESISPILRLRKRPDSRLHPLSLQNKPGNRSPQRPSRFQALPSWPAIFSDAYIPSPFKPEFLDQLPKPWAPNRVEGEKVTPFWHGIYVVLPGGAPNATGRYWCWSLVWPPRRNKTTKPPVSKIPGGSTAKPGGSSRAATKATEPMSEKPHSEVTPPGPFTASPEMNVTEERTPENPSAQSTLPSTEVETFMPRSGTALTTQVPRFTDVPSSDPEATGGQEVENAGPHTTPFGISELPKTTESPLTTASWIDAPIGHGGTTRQSSPFPGTETPGTDTMTPSVDITMNEVRPSVSQSPSGVLVNRGVGVEIRNYTVRFPGVIKDN
ncbi:anti-sigma-I factor RsgI2-like [Dermacentor albipictus]|uniref:anti-sigma-I factor RsgI2-like n=1 Tax=Dermacentor albipictus TaxID=60249 RepID=UPI0038FC806E